ncbi:MAG: PTS glucose transporter subunit IIA [Streptococcaceae bacterium]|jgi:glucose-specific phosphotransferase system IIA component|nr:PTS glucose transporter subunit IIA [Streptococcaceae bacterium]MCH4176127.1 PTS glucose transporter subunit IIA [Streptococcaceae bacterium]
MTFFNQIKKRLAQNNSDEGILSPINGQIFPINEVTDSVFSEQLLGQSISIYPVETKQTIVAPVSGTLELLYPTGHAFGIRMNDGMSILVHIGIDTVNLNGKFFEVLNKQGNQVSQGDPIVKVDFEALKKADYNLAVIVIITDNPNNNQITFAESGVVNCLERIN